VRKSDANTTEQAVSVMNNIYGVVAVGLVSLRFRDAADVLADEKDDLETANREAFEANPKLAKMIADLGAVSSLGAFITAHAFAAFHVAGAVKTELNRRVEERGEPDDVPPVPEGGLYGVPS